ncbi:MAG: hypothetical protein ACPG4K_01295 [Haloferula sp.]
MKRRSALAMITLGSSLAWAGDWRHELLEEEGLGTTREEWRQSLKGTSLDQDGLMAAYLRLGSPRYPEREEAQQKFLRGGLGTQQWLRQQPPSADPEVRIRVAEILDVLEFPSRNGRKRMVQHALSSLLEGAESESDASTGGMFYEWFGQPAEDLKGGFRGFEFEAGEGMLGDVEGGMLVLKGNRPGDGDQRLILKAENWPARETFPDELTVSAQLGGRDGGQGAWHLGITVGRVRALYHPGYRGGGFRFEQVGTRKEFTGNEDMGFTPSVTEMQHMRVKVRRLENGSVELVVRVEQEGEEAFERTTTVSSTEIGELDQVSLDRSGRTGGDAHFDEFVVEFRP